MVEATTAESSEHSDFDLLDLVVARAGTTSGNNATGAAKVKDENSEEGIKEEEKKKLKKQSDEEVKLVQNQQQLKPAKKDKDEKQKHITFGIGSSCVVSSSCNKSTKRTKERSDADNLRNSTTSVEAVMRYALEENLFSLSNENDGNDPHTDDYLIKEEKTLNVASGVPQPPALNREVGGVQRETSVGAYRATSSGELILEFNDDEDHDDGCSSESKADDAGSGRFKQQQQGTTTTTASNGGGDNNNNNNQGLSVAMPIEETDPLALPRAVHHDAAATSTTGEGGRMAGSHNKNRLWMKNRCFLGLLVLLAVVIIFSGGILVGVFLSQQSSDTTNDINSEAEDKPGSASTLSPTQVPTTLSNEEWILSQLTPETINIINNDPESPQAKAFDWILVDITSTDDTSDSTALQRGRHKHPMQRYSLAVLYYSMNGDEWLANDNWLNHTMNECEWYSKQNFGMKAELSGQLPYFLDDFVQPTERCDQDGKFLHLWLDANGLVGSIPEELYLHMDALQTISMGFNQIEGTISTNIGKLTDLIGIFIPFAALTRTLPSELGLLSSLEIANFFVNGLTGQVPDTLWTSFPNMTCWAFTSSNPQIEPYTLPTDIGIMTKMRWFAPEKSNAYGTLPSEIGLMTDMVGFWFSGVEGSDSVVTGELPSELGLMSGMYTMELGSNALTGTIPTEFGQLENLNYLDLHNNSLTGTLPLELEFLSNLDNLLIQGNSFSGVVPEGLCTINGSCYAYPSHCASLEKPLLFDCGSELCGCGCSCNNNSEI